jgi:hypothetical protein
MSGPHAAVCPQPAKAVSGCCDDINRKYGQHQQFAGARDILGTLAAEYVLNTEDGEDFVMMVAMGFFLPTAQRYHMALSSRSLSAVHSH